MNAVAIKTAARVGYPREKMLGVWWAGSEEDTIPAGDAAKGYTTMTFNTPGNHPVIDEIRKKVHGSGKGNLADKDRIGSVYHMRGITAAMLWVEGICNAQTKYGKGKVMTGEQIRWGLENLNVTGRQKALGAFGMFPTVKTSCDDHEGPGATKVQVWDGKTWKAITRTGWWVTARWCRNWSLSPRPNTPPRKRSPPPAPLDKVLLRARDASLPASPCVHMHASPAGASPTRARDALNDLSSVCCRKQLLRLFLQHSDPLKPITNTHRNHVRPLSVNNIEVIYDHVILVLKGVA